MSGKGTKQTIFESAIKIFSECGYEKATMDDIALKAGVAKGTLYYHFKSKYEIFNYILKQGMDVIFKNMEDALKNENNPIIKLKILCKSQLHFVCENRDFIRTVISEVWGQDVRQLEARDFVLTYINKLEGYINEAMEVKTIKKGNASFLAYTFFGALCSTAVYELVNGQAENIEELIDSLIDSTLQAIT